MYRIIYTLLGWDYYGAKEREQYAKQTRLKTQLHKQIKNTDMKKLLFKKCCSRKKIRKRVIPMGIPVL